MDKLVQIVNWNLPNSPSYQMYMYGEADVESNKQMQKPLEKLYQYEKQPNMREKVKEYIGELDTEIDRLERDLEKQMIFNVETTKVAITESRMKTLIDVKTDLEGRLMEDVWWIW